MPVLAVYNMWDEDSQIRANHGVYEKSVEGKSKIWFLLQQLIYQS